MRSLSLARISFCTFILLPAPALHAGFTRASLFTTSSLSTLFCLFVFWCTFAWHYTPALSSPPLWVPLLTSLSHGYSLTSLSRYFTLSLCLLLLPSHRRPLLHLSCATSCKHTSLSTTPHSLILLGHASVREGLLWTDMPPGAHTCLPLPPFLRFLYTFCIYSLLSLTVVTPPAHLLVVFSRRGGAPSLTCRVCRTCTLSCPTGPELTSLHRLFSLTVYRFAVEHFTGLHGRDYQRLSSTHAHWFAMRYTFLYTPLYLPPMHTLRHLTTPLSSPSLLLAHYLLYHAPASLPCEHHHNSAPLTGLADRGLISAGTTSLYLLFLTTAYSFCCAQPLVARTHHGRCRAFIPRVWTCTVRVVTLLTRPYRFSHFYIFSLAPLVRDTCAVCVTYARSLAGRTTLPLSLPFRGLSIATALEGTRHSVAAAFCGGLLSSGGGDSHFL